MKDWLPSNDTELHDAVRSLTGYDLDECELTEEDLERILNSAKMRTYNRLQEESWYSDAGATQALLFTTAILTKAEMENYNISQWTIGNEERVEVMDEYDDSGQYQEWNKMVIEGFQSAGDGRLQLETTGSFVGQEHPDRKRTHHR